MHLRTIVMFCKIWLFVGRNIKLVKHAAQDRASDQLKGSSGAICW